MMLSGFTDDHSIRKSFTANVTHLKEKQTTPWKTLTTIADWMTSMWLKLNGDKTEFIMFSSRQMLKYANTSHLNFGTTPIQWSRLVKYLGRHLDSCLTLEEHLKQKFKAAMLNFIKFKTMRPNLTATACHTLELMCCISHLDYSNALSYGITMKLPQKYQRIQNMCAKLVFNEYKYDSATECLKQLHWLPIEQWIQHKILVITHKVLNGHAPKYIQELLNDKEAPSRQLRSRSSGRLLNTPRVRKETFVSRSFSYAALVLWNSLPRHLWDETSTTIFRKHCTTYLFKKAFNL